MFSCSFSFSFLLFPLTSSLFPGRRRDWVSLSLLGLHKAFDCCAVELRPAKRTFCLFSDATLCARRDSPELGRTIPNIDPATLAEEEEAFGDYDDEDEAIDKYTEVVWAEYAKKGERVLPKKDIQKFFKDALMLISYRKGTEPKLILGNIKEKDALETAFAYLSQDGKTVTFEKWKDFVSRIVLQAVLVRPLFSNIPFSRQINMADLNDILKLLKGEQI